MSKDYNKKEYQKQQEQKMNAIQETLREISETYQVDPELLAEAFTFGAKFEKYSLRNASLISRQNQGAQYVASFNKWKELGYSVNKGEKGLQILAPVQTTYFSLSGNTDKNARWKQLKYASKKEKELVKSKSIPTKVVQGYRIGHVFDIAQTNYPVEEYPKLFHVGYTSEQHEQLFVQLSEHIENTGIAKVAVSDLSSISLRGHYIPSKKLIEINDKLKPTEKLSTLTHELGHALLHTKEPLNKTPIQIECEADAISIMLQQEFGIALTDSRKRHFANHFKAFQKEPDFDMNKFMNGVKDEYRTFMNDFHAQVAAPLQENISDLYEAEPARLFVDMDGVLAEFQHVDTLEVLYEENYFLNLEPQQNVVDAIKKIVTTRKDIEVHIMSSVLSDSAFALAEKNAWLDKHLPEIPNVRRHFPACGTNKALAVPHGILEKDFLLDDYTQNLNDWFPPERAIKLMNGINHTKGTWQGDKVDYDAERLYENIQSVIKEQIQATHKETKPVEKKPTKEPAYIASNAEIEYVKENISMVDVAAGLGYEVKKVGRYYTLAQHDSVRIYPETNSFYRNSTQDGGSTIDFVMHFGEKDTKEAIKYLKEKYLHGVSTDEIKTYRPKPKVVLAKEPMELPEKFNGKPNRVRAYLTKTREIHKDVVQHCMKNKLIYEDTKHNVVFVGYDNKTSKPVFATKRSSMSFSNFKGDVKNADQTTGFKVEYPNAERVYVLEAPIDALSVMSLRLEQGEVVENSNYLAMCGAGKTAVVENYLQTRPHIKEVILATDNDEAGRSAKDKLQGIVSEQYPNAVIREMHIAGECNDINDHLKLFHKQQKQEKKMTKQLKKTNAQDIELGI